MSITASIRHDISGLNAQNRYKRNRGKASAALEKLASGYRINRSADDAAGLSISEKMRMEITGLSRADNNSKEGIRLIQTGEGALDEVHAMLNRLSLLAEQSANGTYQDELDRESLQEELEQLCGEISRIAESTNFNGVELFQDISYEMETYVEPYYRKILAEINHGAAAAPEVRKTVLTAENMACLEQLQKNTQPDELNIVYIEHDFSTTQSGADGAPATGVGNAALDLVMDGTGGKNLSEVLKTAIVPQTVQNLLASYPAFGYLKGSSIGIGLRLYDDAGDSAMASVTGGVNTGKLQSYMLSVNIAHFTKDGATTITEEDRSRLESTIAHEMIHAFMDEATTAGMFGYNSATGTFENASHTFPSWFIEGMAQTASGPGNWLKKPTREELPDGGFIVTSYGGLEIDKDSTPAEIKAAISKFQLNPAKGASSASQYGTGYLACMYLGAAITARADGKAVTDCADAASISAGLNKLLSEVINGSSLDSAIAKYAGFTNTANFQSQFNSGTAANMFPFIQNLLANTGDGMGGIITGDLTNKDPASNSDLSGIKLFELDTDHSKVNNIYPADHETITGGTTSASGTAPTELTPTTSVFGDFEVYGTDLSGISFDAGVLTIGGVGDVRVRMKSGVTSSTQTINITGSGTVTLDGVNAAALNLQNADGKVALTGKNVIHNIQMDAGTAVTFSGGGQLKTDAFTADSSNTVLCAGGALIVGSAGGGSIGGTVKVNGASVAAALTGVTSPAGTALEKYEIDWTLLSKLGGSITSVLVNGVKTDMLLSKDDAGALWLDKKETTAPDGTKSYARQKLVFNGTDSSGKAVHQACSVKWDPDAGKFSVISYNVFEVTGGVQGTDWVFDEDKNILRILSNKDLTISGGTVAADGTTDYGAIEIADGVGANLTLDGVQIDATKLGGDTAGIQLGNGGKVNLTMRGDNTIIGSGQSAGIQVFGYSKRGTATGTLEESTLNIDMEKGSTLTATGGTSGSMGGAGIGAAWASDASASSINITGEGTIIANGGNGGAGIGGSEGGNLKDISIDGSDSDGDGAGLIITATGGNHGAGIGAGGWVSSYSDPATQVVGDITIKGAVNITKASSKLHGTGIGSACHSTVGNITIGEDPAGDPTVNDKLIINAEGGNDGAAIGSGWQGKMGVLTIWGGVITAEAGARGAGIGSGYEAKGGNGNIVIKGGEIVATGAENASGIGSGMNGSIDGVTIEGGTITADGGWSADGGNIGGYDAKGDEIKISIPDPNNLTIKAGTEGEGLYITTGAFDKDDDQLFALKIGYIDELLKKGAAGGGIDSDPPGSAGLAFPLTEITATLDGMPVSDYKWNNIKHLAEEGAYIWMKGQDLKLTVKYSDGGTDYILKDIELKFYPDYGLWRYSAADLPAEVPEKPGYIGGGGGGGTTQPENPEPEKPDLSGKGGIILQIGTGIRDILAVPRFYLSRASLKLDKLDISTQSSAMNSMTIIKEAINRVSEIRGTYGALSNRLEHNMSTLRVTSENLTDAESSIRDTDMAMEMSDYVRQNILTQTSQAMLAQCNQRASDVMQLLQ